MKCTLTKPNGIQCGAQALHESAYCFTHDPNKKEEHALAVRKGGLAPKKVLLHNKEGIELRTAEDAKRFISMVVSGVWTGEIPAAPTANTLGFLIRCFLDAQNQADLEARVTELEERINKKVSKE